MKIMTQDWWSEPIFYSVMVTSKYKDTGEVFGLRTLVGDVEKKINGTRMMTVAK
jgi:hypothetical protein